MLEDENESLVYINEKFILSYAFNFITESKKSIRYQELNEVKKQCFNGFIESFYYHLKFRNCDPQVLELAMLSFEAGLAVNPYL